MHPTRSLPGLAVGAIALVAAACAAPPTEVIVVLDTDAPARVRSVEAFASRGAGAASSPQGTVWNAPPGPAPITFPASFAVVPGDGPLDGDVTLELDATLSPATPDGPLATLHRRAHFAFLPHQRAYVRIVLAASCGDPVAPPAQCASGASPCTVSQYCSEQGPGTTCGDDGACVSSELPPTPLPSGAPVPGLEGGARDVASTTDVVVTTDVASMDVGEDDAPVSMDVPVTMDVPVAMDVPTSTDAAGDVTVPRDGPPIDSAVRDVVSSDHAVTDATPADASHDAGATDAGCTPDCTRRDCGSDGCGGTCGRCEIGSMCNITTGTCTCRALACGSCSGSCCTNSMGCRYCSLTICSE